MTATNENIIRLAISNPIATHEELAALPFEPESRLAGFDQDPNAIDDHEQKLRHIGIMSRFAIAMLSKSKAELIEAVRKMDEKRDEEVNSMSFLGHLTAAREKTEAILTFLTAAEIRHACAMANVYAGDKANLPPIPAPEKPTLGGPRRRRPH
jgi:hypothetical protein